VYSLVTCSILASLFLWHNFPDCFIEGSGLTNFKTISEYVISIFLLVSGLNVYRYRTNFDPHVLKRILLSIIFIIASELTFTIYATVYDYANLLGHYFKIIAYFLLYQAIVSTGFSKPYKLVLRNLKRSEESLQHALEESKQRERQITGLLESSKAVLKYIEFENSASTILHHCKRATTAAEGYISVWSNKGGESNIIVLPDDRRAHQLTADLPIALRTSRETTARTGEVTYCNALKTGDNSRNSETKQPDIDNVLYAPLKISNEVVGLLGVADKPGGFDDDDARMASAFAEIASISFNKILVLETLENSEERLRSVVQTAGDAIVTINSQGEIIFWNRSAEEIFGYSAEEISDLSVTSIIPERMREAHRHGLRRHLTSDKNTIIGKTIETTGLKKNGLEFPLELSLATWQTMGDSFFTAIIRDITERKQTEEALARAHADLESTVEQRTAELLLQNERLRREIEERIRADNALRESETRYRIVADNTYDWEWWLNPERRFVYISPSCQRITGHAPAEFISDPGLIKRILFPDDRDKFELHVDEVDRERKGGDVEFRIVRKDGSIRWISHLCQPVYDEHGNFLGHRGSNRDTTARKLAEDALGESEKTLRFLSEQLLSVQENERKRIALDVHDGINQTLAAIKFALEKKLAQMSPTKAPEGLTLEDIIKLVQRGIEESRRIQMDLRPSILDDLGISATLSWFIREFQKIYAHVTIDVNVELKEEDVPEGMKIVIFRIVQEAFNNISKHSEADLVRLSLGRTNDRIELVITDDGVGFDPKNVQKGLGMTSMSERTKFSGGQFFLESTPGKQTTVKAIWSLDK
jgi:PAS domain S-box-containing protein